MALITNIKDLEKYTLGLWDRVDFSIDGEVLHYEVNNNHLNGSRISNNAIFDKLGISPFDKRIDYASSIYGYRSGGGAWPESKEGDYVGLTRLVKALYELIENKKKSPFKPLENTKIDKPQNPQVESKVTIPKIKIKYIKSNINSKLKRIK